ncbi:alpha-1,2-fucosyltransferase [Adlercreutzia sp. ZJ473]|uniref:alpha-1,2-fucosyltransferase n=1 Tax=Adlercreutzia sp. ZJ473 TaxID=2722822 RepID=UPI001556EDCB|nr:alpha-1,2-fucosyltransferase [Adlercreutzia sp. ZJ473]
MIVVRLIGGLGNQMFQYAYALSLSKLLNDDDIVFDLGSFESYGIRDYGLDGLSIPETRMINDFPLEKREYRRARMAQKLYRGLQKIIRTANNTDCIGERVFDWFANQGFYFNFDAYYYKPPVSDREIRYVYGYFQGATHFESVEKQIREEFRVSLPIKSLESEYLRAICSCENPVGVSIRCGHGYKGTNLDVCDPEYYYRGMRLVNTLVDNAKFFVFSDDLDHVRQSFVFPFEVVYVEGLNAHESLRALYSCKQFVIANSTFSWWGAYLSAYPQKIIVAPKRWRRNSKGIPDVYSINANYLL